MTTAKCIPQRCNREAFLPKGLEMPGKCRVPKLALCHACLCFSTAQHSTAQHSTAQHSTAQHSTAQHSTAQHSCLCLQSTTHCSTFARQAATMLANALSKLVSIFSSHNSCMQGTKVEGADLRHIFLQSSSGRPYGASASMAVS